MSTLWRNWLVVFSSTVIGCGYVHDHRGFIEDTPSATEAGETKLWPQVVLVYGDSVCTGVIVQHNYVLTAAHCTNSNTSIAVYHHDGPKLGETSDHAAPQDNDPDIALLKFSDQTFSIPPLSLGLDTAKNDVVEVVGFGCNDARTQLGQTIKRQGFNRILEVFEFITLYTPLTTIAKQIVGPDNVAGICRGDSGSPLLKEQRVVGIGSISEVKTDRVYSWYVNLNSAPARQFLAQYLTLP